MSTSTTNRSAQLYAHLSSQQLASIAVGYVAKGDSAELARIIEALPVHRYRAPSRDYFRMVEVMTNLAHLCSIVYWRTRARTTALHGLLLAANGGNYEAPPDTMERLEHGELELGSIEAAWFDLCERMGWDRQALNHIAQMEINDRPSTIDADYYAELMEAWQGVLDSAGFA